MLADYSAFANMFTTIIYAIISFFCMLPSGMISPIA